MARRACQGQGRFTLPSPLFTVLFEKAAEVKAQITALSKELAALRKEVVLCNSIAERSGVIQEKIKAVREDEQIKGKEKCDRTEQQKTVR